MRNLNRSDFRSSSEGGDKDIETILSWTEIGANGLNFYFERRGFDVSPAQSLFYSDLEQRCLDSNALKENIVEAVEGYMSLVGSEGYVNPRVKAEEFVDYDLPGILGSRGVSAADSKNLCYIMFQVFGEAAAVGDGRHSSKTLIDLFRKVSSNLSEIVDAHERDNYLVTLRNFIEHNPRYYSVRMGVDKKLDILSDAVYKSGAKGHQLSELKPDFNEL